MCGLVAVLAAGEAPRVTLDELGARAAALRHRGPDDQGAWLDPAGAVGLAHRRLSIIDLSPAGRQPLANEDGAVQLVMNGEVYNFAALRRELQARGHRFSSGGDAEVIVHGWEEWGPACLERLQGMFAFALWDARARRLFVARDRLGIKPLVWWQAGGRFVCASEPGALLAAEPAPERRLDPLALDAFLALGAVPAPRTIWRGVRKLLPGHWLLVEADGRVSERCWWDLPGGPDEAATRARAGLEVAVRSHLVADVPVGAFLSGGLDSSLVTALAAREAPGLRTFSVVFPGHAAQDEGRWARLVAAHVGSDHRELELRLDARALLEELAPAWDEPFAVASALGVHLLAREAGREVKVVLTGDGGDEVFAGYPWHAGVDAQADQLAALGPLGARLRRGEASPALTQRVRWRAEGALEGAARRARLLALPDPLLRARRYADELSVFNEAERAALYAPGWRPAAPTLEQLQAAHRRPFPDRLQAWRYLDLKTTLPDEMLQKVDLATMRAGLEARVPLLDHLLVEQAFRLPAPLLVDAQGGKAVLRRIARELLPPELLARRKHGFDLPLQAWLQGELRDLIREACQASTLAAQGVLSPDGLRELQTAFERAPTPEVARQLFALGWLELWARAARPAA